jgi:uncharacterized protein YacL
MKYTLITIAILQIVMAGISTYRNYTVNETYKKVIISNNKYTAATDRQTVEFKKVSAKIDSLSVVHKRIRAALEKDLKENEVLIPW